MIPLRSLKPARRLPVATSVLIAFNCLVFLYAQSLDRQAFNHLIRSASLIPYQVTHELDSSVARDLLTSMFLHGSWLHLLSNMLYLWIFGKNIEDLLGPFRYLIFFCLCGVLASLTQVVANPDATVPIVGASGAIAGVLGAYIVIFPHARIQTLVVFVYFIRLVELRAIVVLGFWFVLQFFYSLSAAGRDGTSGIAYFAHIGGFVAGAGLILLFQAGKRRRTHHLGRKRDFLEDEFPDLWE